jgi:lipopolysaccharide export system permease protein
MKSDIQFRDEEVMPIPESPREFLAQQQKPEFMTIAQLNSYISKLARSGATGVVKKLKVDLYQRFTMPLTSGIIMLLAIPFSLMVRRRATGLASLGLSIIVGFLYYVVTAVSIALGYAGILPPFLAASASHLAVITVSLYLIRGLP